MLIVSVIAVVLCTRFVLFLTRSSTQSVNADDDSYVCGKCRSYRELFPPLSSLRCQSRIRALWTGPGR